MLSLQQESGTSESQRSQALAEFFWGMGLSALESEQGEEIVLLQLPTVNIHRTRSLTGHRERKGPQAQRHRTKRGNRSPSEMEGEVERQSKHSSDHQVRLFHGGWNFFESCQS